MIKPESNIPTVFFIFGVAGDLAQTKLLPALFHLHKERMLPDKFHIVGFGRRDWDRSQFEEFIGSVLKEDFRDFLKYLSYQKGTFNDLADYKIASDNLSKIDEEFGQCSNKLFYLAVPPVYYEAIFKNLHTSGLSKPCGGVSGWTRVLVEKPFGNDLKSARSINKLLGKLFEEEQIFRIDHYLAKDTIQNILTFRENNQLFESLWNGKSIEKIKATILEERPVGSRGAFYDDVGALKDVGQNHLMQMIALVTMNLSSKPQTSADIQKARAKVVKNFKLAPKADLVRAQYDGYLEEKGVKEGSQTETYFRVEFLSKNKQWRNTKFILESGKAFKQSEAKIEVYFRSIKNKTPQNVLTFFIQPKQGIELSFGDKKLSLSFEKENKKSLDAYEKILLDCVYGDQTLFASTEEVEFAWSIIMLVLDKWKNKKLLRYPQKLEKFLE
ncbi:MAG: glucose-6-phosphate dehydrogenase [bacterium]